MPVKRIVHVFGELNRGGAETRTMEIYRRIDKTAFQFDFICFGSERGFDYSEEVRRLGGRIYFLDPGVINEYSGLIKILTQYGPFFAVQSHISHHSSIIMFSAKRAGIKWRITHARTSSDDHQSLPRKLYFVISKAIIRRYANIYLACGMEAGIYLFGEKSVKRGRVIYLPNAIDLTKFEYQKETSREIKKRLGIPENKIVIGHVGNLKPVKNHMFLIELFNSYHKQNSDSILLLVGSGELFKVLREKVFQLGLHDCVFFLGVRTDVVAILHTFDIFILPSFYEGVPGVIVEAQAAGIPCMLSSKISHDMDVGTDLLNYMELEKGAVFWSQMIDKIIHEKHMGKEHCIMLLRKSGFDIENSTKRLIDLYEKLENYN